MSPECAREHQALPAQQAGSVGMTAEVAGPACVPSARRTSTRGTALGKASVPLHSLCSALAEQGPFPDFHISAKEGSIGFSFCK